MNRMLDYVAHELKYNINSHKCNQVEYVAYSFENL